MELSGVNREGKIVRANVRDFAKDNMQENERIVGLGSAPHNIVYQNDLTGKSREVDLRELASLGGLDDVKFKFTREGAQKQGFLSNAVEIDQGLAYNIERIKTVEGRQKYLQSKGVQGFFHEKGEDFFTIKDGYVLPLNNKDGFDVSDLTRMGANVGRDLGAMAGVIASGVGAVATGGLSLGVASAAGAGGAVLGEMAHRGVDRLLGTGAAEQNANLSASEEGIELLKSGGIGAVGGAGGQFVAKGAALAGIGAMKAGAAATTGKVEEWFMTQAAKKEASFLANQMPSGWMAKQLGQTTEEAAAKGLLEQAGKAKEMEQVKTLTQEAQEQITLGSAKRGGDAASIAQAQEQVMLREQAKARAQQAATQAENDAMTTYADKVTTQERFGLYKERMVENAREQLPKHTDLVEEVLKPGGDDAKARRAYDTIENEIIGELKAAGIVDKAGINKDAQQKFIQKTFDDAIEESSAYVNNIADKALLMKTIPSDKSRGYVVEAMRNVSKKLQDIKPDLKDSGSAVESIRRTIKAVSKHDLDGGADVSHYFKEFLDLSRRTADDKSLPPSFHNAVREANERVFQYIQEGSKFPNAVRDLQHVQNAVLAIRATRRASVFDQQGGTKRALEQLSDLQVMTGDTPEATNKIAQALHIEDMFNNSKSSEYWAYMSDGARAKMQALQLLRSEVVAKSTSAGAKKDAQQGWIGGAIGVAADLALTGGAYSIPAAILGQGALQTAKTEAIKKGASVAAKATATGAKKVAETITKPKFVRSAATYGLEESRAQRKVGDLLQKWTKTGNNDE